MAQRLKKIAARFPRRPQPVPNKAPYAARAAGPRNGHAATLALVQQPERRPSKRRMPPGRASRAAAEAT